MKRFLSLLLAFVFVMGICASAPMTITANAADSHSLEFKLNSDGKSYSVVDYEYDFENRSTLVIPGTYNGLPVTKIEKDALMGLMASEVVISEGITEIGEMAFFEGAGIQKLTLPKSLKTIGYSAFGRCWQLKTVKFSEGLVSIGEKAFFEVGQMSSIVLPSTLKTIEKEAFLSCDNLKKVVIKNSNVKIGSKAFGYGVPHNVGSNYKITDLVLYAPKGSTTQTYAKNNGFKFVVKNANSVTLATPTVKTSNTTKGIKITWNKIKNAESYRVYRRTYNKSTKEYSSWKTIKNTTGLSYTDKTVKLGTKYSYTVRAIKGNVASKYTATKGLKYNIAPTVKVANASSGIKVTWNTIANATGYTIYRKSYNTQTKKWESWENITTAKASKTSWTDKSVKSGVYYKYTVRACNGKSFKSEYKSSDKILYLARPTVKLENNASGVEVSWNKVTGAKGYIVYRTEFNDETQKYSSWKNYGEVSGNVFDWTDTSVVQGATYKYTVRAKSGNFKSAYIGNVSITLPIVEDTTVPATDAINAEQNQ